MKISFFVSAVIALFITQLSLHASQSSVLWHNSTTGAVKIMPINEMNPTPYFSVVDSSNTNLVPRGMADFTGDNEPDILFHNQNSGNLRIWEMDGTVKVDNIQVLGSSNTNLKIAGVGDFDGDGDNDIATFNTNSGALRIWVMDGITRVDNVLVLTGANTNLAPRGAGDMDGDGVPDLVLRNNNSGAVRIWTMNSDFTRKGNEYIRSSSNTNLELRGVVDINEDGNNDILNYNTSTGVLRAWLMDGDLSITENAEIVQESNLEWSVRGGGANNSSKGIILETEDDKNPYITIGDNGNIVSFYVNPATGKSIGIAVITLDGREGYLSIDEESGMPEYWVALDTITVFNNIRPDEYLMDISFIYEDGTTETVEDLFYGESIIASKSDKYSILDYRISSQSANSIGEKRKKWNNFFSALDAATSAAACAGSTIVTAGTAIGAAGFPPLGGPLFAVTAGGTTIVCSKAFINFIALKDASVDNINTAKDVPGLLTSLKHCIKPGSWACLKTAFDVVKFTTTGFLTSLQATFLGLKDGRARLNNQWALCCDGPTQIKRRTSGSWKAGVDPLFLDTSPYQFHFYFNDFSNPLIEYSNEYLHSASHSFRDEGEYKIDVKVFDATNKSAVSNKFPVVVYGDLKVKCDHSYGNLEANINEIFSLPFTIEGGKKPFSYEIDLRNGTVQSGVSIAREINEKVMISNAGTYYVEVAVKDADNESSKCTYTLNVVEAGEVGSITATISNVWVEYDNSRFAGEYKDYYTNEAYEGMLTNSAFTGSYSQQTEYVDRSGNIKVTFGKDANGSDIIKDLDFSEHQDTHWGRVVYSKDIIFKLKDIPKVAPMEYRIEGEAVCGHIKDLQYILNSADPDGSHKLVDKECGSFSSIDIRINP